MEDKINPNHYKQKGLETIDVIKAFTSEEGFEGYCVGNIIKYTLRYRNKNGLEDLRKARWYLNYLIDFLSKEDLFVATDGKITKREEK